ncbi:hypothetical protein EDB81DRAFT_163880 [Dactylonectria macrodidyma]|uniref:Uncharacterized protein n=1 Tax=Dactylonectria macrodidyma TaxID=307937 RepID=A0A9P9FRF5_9HYPO|nr:hypothetical protein EDB81DRAFT_163880 [Dactylonectria macrodidyma]
MLIHSDGRLLSAVLIEHIRRYEKSWITAYNQGSNVDTVLLPIMSKDMVAGIIRECPIVTSGTDRPGKGLKSQNYSTAWLLRNVGGRFFHEGGVRKPAPELRLNPSIIAGNISQNDLGWSDQVWKSIRPIFSIPKSRKRRHSSSDIPPPQYFAPCQDLMRAQLAFRGYASSGSIDEDVWLALMALPTRLLHEVARAEQGHTDPTWYASLGRSPPTARQAEFLTKGWKRIEHYRVLQFPSGRQQRQGTTQQYYTKDPFRLSLLNGKRSPR